MSTNNRNQDEEEIDLSVLARKIKELFEIVNSSIFLAIRFILKRIVILGVLCFLGIGVGLYLDKIKRTYDNEIIVMPNFGSTDYLYSKVELLSSKINQGDTLFFKSIGITAPSKLLQIKIEPVVDIYRFIGSNDKDRNELNFELLKLMAEDSDMKKIVKEKETSKNYSFHKITFITSKLSGRKEIVDPLLKYLNSSTYYNALKEGYIRNENTKILKNEEIISQIDIFLNEFAREGAVQKNDKLIYYNENTQLNEVIQTKNNLIGEIGRLKLDLITIDSVIKESSSSLNILNTKSINGKQKMILPILFIFVYLLTIIFIKFYKTQAAKYNQNQ